MTKEEFENLLPFMVTLKKEQVEVIWYLEARKRGNPCITNKQKEKALNDTLIDHHKIKLHD